MGVNLAGRGWRHGHLRLWLAGPGCHGAGQAVRGADNGVLKPLRCDQARAEEAGERDAAGEKQFRHG